MIYILFTLRVQLIVFRLVNNFNLLKFCLSTLRCFLTLTLYTTTGSCHKHMLHTHTHDRIGFYPFRVLVLPVFNASSCHKCGRQHDHVLCYVCLSLCLVIAVRYKSVPFDYVMYNHAQLIMFVVFIP